MTSRSIVQLWVATTCSLVAAVALADSPSQQAAAGQPVPTIREAVDNLPEFTIYRPADLSKFSKMPIFVWDNGACRNDNRPYATLLSNIAAAGVFVIAKGPYMGEVTPLRPHSLVLNPSPAPEPPVAVDPPTMKDTQGSRDVLDAETKLMLSTLDWAAKENKKNGSPYKGKMDLGKVVSSGFSCGGRTAIAMAVADKRIHSVLGYNTASSANDGEPERREAILKITVPHAWINGGPSDIAYYGAEKDYAQPLKHPAYQANHALSTHFLLWKAEDSQKELAEIGVHWIDFTLRGSKSARDYFLGTPCGFCDNPFWSVKYKNFDKFAAKK